MNILRMVRSCALIILFAFLGICMIVGCKRAMRVVVRGINYLFDKIEEKIGC